jgi:AraC-like DNA-binding protein
LELLAGSLYQSIARRGAGGVGGRKSGAMAAGVRDELARRVDRAIERIEVDYGDLLCLRDLASTAGLSPFHFARVFRDATGLPPHRYLTAVRLRHAADRLRQGAAVTETCFDVGFGSLSHFITAFRARFGVLPSSAARGARVPTVLASVRGSS